jgi:hypothetical protein
LGSVGHVGANVQRAKGRIHLSPSGLAADQIRSADECRHLGIQRVTVEILRRRQLGYAPFTHHPHQIGH